MRFDRLGAFLLGLFGLRPDFHPAGRTGLPSRVFRLAARTEGERLRSFGDRRLRRLEGRARREAAERAERLRRARLGWFGPYLELLEPRG